MALRFGEFVFDPEQRRLARGSEPVHLSPRTFKLLEVLLEARPRALSKRELMEKIWPDAVVEESNLKTTVSELRTALGTTDVIRTVQRYGYSFSAEVLTDSAPRYRLFIDGRHLAPSREEAIIGRQAGCDIWIDSPDISRRHARITVRPNAFVLEDLGSKNGTWVGGDRLAAPHELQDGDRIRVADVTLIFRTGSGEESTVSADRASRRSQ